MPLKMDLSEHISSSLGSHKPSRAGVIIIYLFFIAVVARTLALAVIAPRLPWYLGLETLFLVLLTVVLLRPGIPTYWVFLYLTAQTIIILVLLSFRPQFDFVTVLFVILSYQAANIFPNQTRWIWVGLFVLLTGGALVYYLGPAVGLEKALFPMVACIILASYETANQEIEAARAESEEMIGNLQETHRQLELHASQAEELAAVEERNRLARELHDSVSQTMFSILLNIRSSQIYLQREPDQVRPQLELILSLTQNALAQMRSLITHLRRPNPELVSDELPPRQIQDQ
jgi:signal transduction histidine kinase